MSQDINLLNPALRPKKDYFVLRYVAPVTATALMLLFVQLGYARMQLSAAVKAQSVAGDQLVAAQTGLKSLQEALAARKSDPAVEAEQTRLSAVVRQRDDVLQLAQGLETEGRSIAEVMRAFARQRTEGVWLTGFRIGPSGFDIRGRLLDPAALPVYIRRLNGESAFRGREFAALDMQGVQPAAGVPGQPVPEPPVSGPSRYTEFVLRANIVPASVSARESKE